MTEKRQRTGSIRRSKPERRYHDRRTDEERRRIPVEEVEVVKKVLVTGDRGWDDIPRVVEELKGYRPGTILIHGKCRGADVICAAVAEALGFEVRGYAADWTKHPRAAGPIRNQQMVDQEHTVDSPIDICIAFHNSIQDSRGTADMLDRAVRAGIPWKLVRSHVPVDEGVETSARVYTEE